MDLCIPTYLADDLVHTYDLGYPLNMINIKFGSRLKALVPDYKGTNLHLVIEVLHQIKTRKNNVLTTI